MLMFIAVEGYAVCSAKGEPYLGMIITVLAVAAFIFCGFNHSIADMFYLFLYGFRAKYIPYVVVAVLGNAAGGMLIPLTQRFFVKE